MRTRQTPAIQRAADPSAARAAVVEAPPLLPRAAGHLERDPVGRIETLHQRPHPLRRRRDPAGRVHLASSQIAIWQKSRCTSSPTQRPTAATTTCSPLTSLVAEG